VELVQAKVMKNTIVPKLKTIDFVRS